MGSQELQKRSLDIMLRRFRVPAISCLIVFVLFASPAPAAESGASAVVATFQAGMLRVMKQAGARGIRARYEMLLPIVARAFHVKLMVSIVTGRHRKSGTEAETRRLVQAFRRMSVSTLATHLDGYDGERFEVVRERPGRGATVMVDTRIVRPDRDPVDISYVVSHDGGRWRIVDVVVAGGISELTVRRSEYARILKSGGVAALVAALAGKARRILAGSVAAALGSAQR
jgi:phospholipid transport system substrate-binding protein